MSTFPVKILVATDGSEDAALAVQAAVDLSNETGADLHVVHVGESLPVYPPPASGPPPPSPSREEILRLSEEISRRPALSVVGNQGLSGRFSRMRRFIMGSVSENVTRYARCSVMVVRKKPL